MGLLGLLIHTCVKLHLLYGLLLLDHLHHWWAYDFWLDHLGSSLWFYDLNILCRAWLLDQHWCSRLDDLSGNRCLNLCGSCLIQNFLWLSWLGNIGCGFDWLHVLLLWNDSLGRYVLSLIVCCSSLIIATELHIGIPLIKSLIRVISLQKSIHVILGQLAGLISLMSW